MQDELFMKGWNEGHSRFSADLDRTLGHLVDRFSRPGTRRKAIGNPYGIPVEARAQPTLSPAARASLRGLAASLITVVLWVVVLALATPAPGLAASPVTQLVSADCIAHPFLA